MMRRPKLFDKMKNRQATQNQDEKPAVTQETAERLAHEAYEKAFADAKGLFDSSLQIDQKMSAGIEQVNRRWKWYIGVCSSIAAIISFFGVPQFAESIRERVTEQFVGKEAERQINQFTDTKVSDMIVTRVSNTEERVKATFTQYMDEQVKSFEQRSEELDERIKEAEALINVYEKCASARAGTRKDYDFLVELSVNTNRVAHVASSTVEEIRKSFEQKKSSLITQRPLLVYKDNRDKKVPEDDMILAVYSDSVGRCDGAIKSRADKNEKTDVAVLMHAVKSSQYLDFVYAAIRGIEKLTGDTFPALGIQETLDWWKANEANPIYHCAFERYTETAQLPNESMDDCIWRKIDFLLDWIGENTNQYSSASLLVPMLLFANGNGEKEQKRQDSLEKVFEYWTAENPKVDNWYVYKALYLARYSPNSLVVFVNERLKEHPTFEDELKRWTFYFNPEFFELPVINWPSKSTMQLQDGGTPEKTAE